MKSPLEPYAGRWAIVTGACSGIGRAYAEAMAAAGLKVLMVSDDAERLTETSQAIARAHAVEVDTRCIDLSRLDFETAIDEWLRTHDVAVLVSNASFGMGGKLWEQDRARLRQMVDLNVGAYLLLVHASTQTFVAKGQGLVILVSSLNVASPVPQAATYTATKAFEFYLGTALWHELQGTGVVVQTVLPGPTRTRFQAVAGTRTPRVAITPEELVRLAVPHIGRAPVFVPTWHHQVAFRLAPLLPLKTRIQIAGEFYDKLLHHTPEVGLVRMLWRAMAAKRIPER